MMIVKHWSEFKSFVDTKGVSIQYADISSKYIMAAVDGPFIIEYTMAKDGSADQIDFDTNYKSSGNAIINPVDTDTGMPSISTRKLPSDWYPEFREIEFTTSELNSIHDKDEDDVDIGHHTAKYYKLDAGNEVEITSPTQTDLDNDCVKTVITFAPSRLWAIRGSYTRQIAVPTSPVYVWTTFIIEAAPSYFVRNPFANGGLNMEFQDVRQSVGDEGENYSFFNANDKIEWIIRHPAGLKHRIRIIYQLAFKVGG